MLNPFSPPMILTERSGSRADLAPHPGMRSLSALGAGAFLVGALVSGDPVWLAGTALALPACLAEDRWIFDAARRIVSRRFGILPFPRVVELSFDEIEGMFFESSAPSREADPPAGPEALYGRLVGAGRRGWSCWGLVLASGRDLAVRAGPLRSREALRDQAARVAALLGGDLRVR